MRAPHPARQGGIWPTRGRAGHARPTLGLGNPGPGSRGFEREFADFCGARHAVAVTNCTVSLHLALLVSGVRPGQEVITVSHSFIATANAIRHCGALPVFVDIRLDDLNMDLSLIHI